MIRIPLYLAVAQWALLAALTGLVIVMFRQLGRLVGGRAAGGRSAGGRPGPPIGEHAARLGYLRPAEQEVRYFSPGGGRPALVAFADPTCPSCEELVSALGHAARSGELAGLRVLVLVSDPPDYLAVSAAFATAMSAGAVEIGRPADRAGLEFYRVTATPLLVAVDADGVVRKAGPAARAADVLAFAQACLLPVPQDTLAVVPAATASGEGP